MSGPTSAVAIASLAVGAVGAGVGAYGAIQSGEAQQAAANYQAQVARNNATIAGQNAAYATAAGNAQAEQSTMKTNAVVGAMMAGQAASGIDVGSGSALDTRTSQKEVGALEVGTIRNQAAWKAYGYQTQSMSDTAQAGLDTAQGSAAATAGDIGGVSSVLGGAASAGSKYAQWQQIANNTPNLGANTPYVLNTGGT
jgi:hypothetical protein